jgi:osmoprotectant transport system substrate-binding protein
MLSDSAAPYQTVKKFDAAKGILWLQPSEVNDTYTLIMKRANAERLGIHSISDLTAYVRTHGSSLRLGSTAEFSVRLDSYPLLQKVYGLHFGLDQISVMDPGLLYGALKDNKVDVSVGFATDGRIPKFDLVTLKDDKHAFPAYEAVPVIRKDVADENPQLVALLNTISPKLNDAAMARLNAEVDVEKKDVAVVAQEWLGQVGLITKK